MRHSPTRRRATLIGATVLTTCLATLAAGTVVSAAPVTAGISAGRITPRGCTPAKPLSSKYIKITKKINADTTLTTWMDPVSTYSWWGGRRQLQVSVVKGSLAKARVDVQHRGFPDVTDPATLATQKGTLALVNGDFFDMFETGDQSPQSAVIAAGRLSYAPPGWSNVLGQSERVIPATEIQKVRGSIKVGSVVIPISATNARRVPTGSAVVYDTRWTGGKATPRGSVTLTVRDGHIASAYASGSTVVPSSTTKIIQVPLKYRALALKMKRGLRATIAVTATDGTSAVPRTVREMSATQVRAAGGLTAGAISIPLTSLNYHRAPGSGIAVYDANWKLSSTPRGAATLVITKGVVTAKHSSGRSIPVSTGSTVVQVSKSSARVARTITIGSRVSLSVRYESRNKAVLTEAIGRGSEVLKAGAYTSVCNWQADSQRPRTAIGWDRAGHVWFMTTTSGRKDQSYGAYRTGGSTLHEVGVWMKGLGATDAVVLDGGGSTVLMIPGSKGPVRVDLPANSYRRWVPNALSLVVA